MYQGLILCIRFWYSLSRPDSRSWMTSSGSENQSDGFYQDLMESIRICISSWWFFFDWDFGQFSLDIRYYTYRLYLRYPADILHILVSGVHISSKVLSHPLDLTYLISNQCKINQRNIRYPTQSNSKWLKKIFQPNLAYAIAPVYSNLQSVYIVWTYVQPETWQKPRSGLR